MLTRKKVVVEVSNVWGENLFREALGWGLCREVAITVRIAVLYCQQVLQKEKRYTFWDTFPVLSEAYDYFGSSRWLCGVQVPCHLRVDIEPYPPVLVGQRQWQRTISIQVLQAFSKAPIFQTDLVASCPEPTYFLQVGCTNLNGTFFGAY